jgi:hypothetical protein
MAIECGSCSLRFTSVGAFDMHRAGGYGDPIYKPLASGKHHEVIGYTPHTRHCLSISEMQEKGMVQVSDGRWSTGQFDAEATERLKGRGMHLSTA